ncbi:MAG: hypothetical protein NUV56_03175 [Candidatus Uhrbacteria bacterium]|nr:hypothetical protein [Candidatus Uhrbacteria bacterium]
MEEITMLMSIMLAQLAWAEGGTSFDRINGADWTDQEAVIAAIEAYDGYDHTLETGIMRDPDNANVIYFATSSTQEQDDGSFANRLSIFSYDQDSLIFMRQWRVDGRADIEWNVVGVDAGRVVWIEQPADYQAGDECAEPVVTGNDHTDNTSLWSIPTDNLVVNDDGTLSWRETASAYTPSQEVLDERWQRQTDCQGVGTTGDA